MSAKQNILNKITEALMQSVPLPFPKSVGDSDVFVKPDVDNITLFAQQFTRLQGIFSICKNEEDLQQQLSTLITQKAWAKVFCKELQIQNILSNINIANYKDLPTCQVSITSCEALVARTGTMVLTTAQASGRTTSVYAPIHICIAYEQQVVYDIKNALVQLKQKYESNFPSFVTFASGPSRTADIEKTLVTGVHGPKEVYCFLVQSK